MDITDTTASTEDVLEGQVFYSASGARSIGTLGDMTGATASTDGASGLVPAPSAGDEDKFLAGDGTYKSGGLPMVILSYGHSTWAEFESAYNNNVIVIRQLCAISSVGRAVDS